MVIKGKIGGEIFQQATGTTWTAAFPVHIGNFSNVLFF